MTKTRASPWFDSSTLGAGLAFVTLSIAGCSPQVIDAVDGSAQVCVGGASGLGGTSGASGVSGGNTAGAGNAGLIHRYTFDGPASSAEATDVVGTAHGRIVNTTLSGEGSVVLSGVTSEMQYVDLPNYIVSRLTDATFEAWLSWDGTGPVWQRVFDFGEDLSGVDLGPEPRPADSPENQAFAGILYSGRSYLYFTVRGDATATNPIRALRLAYLKPVPPASRTPPNRVQAVENAIESTTALPSNRVVHSAVTIDSAARSMSLFLDGALVRSVPFVDSLADIHDVNNWLGRSQYTDDPLLAGTFFEFRIYATALTAAELAANDLAGPDLVAVP